MSSMLPLIERLHVSNNGSNGFQLFVNLNGSAAFHYLSDQSYFNVSNGVNGFIGFNVSKDFNDFNDVHGVNRFMDSTEFNHVGYLHHLSRLM